ncbi:MAG: S16 family serine protease [Mycoplasma sp.]
MVDKINIENKEDLDKYLTKIFSKVNEGLHDHLSVVDFFEPEDEEFDDEEDEGIDSTDTQNPLSLAQYTLELRKKVEALHKEGYISKKQYNTISLSSLGSGELLYLKNVLAIPWKPKEEKEKFSPKYLREQLNLTHFGMDKTKDKIVETIYAREYFDLKTNTICLVGEPGTGKTTIAETIASALNRPFFKISFAGESDENLLTGFSFSYSSSKPGTIMKSLMAAECNNPVILLDEIDKVGEGRGKTCSLQNTLLNLLEPDSQKHFTDVWFDFPFDVSKCLFIATANYVDDISTPLLDRLDLIEIENYKIKEKVQIVRDFVLPYLQKTFKLKNEIQIDDDTILYIIDNFNGWDCGIRDIKKCFTTIFSKASLNSNSTFITEGTPFVIDVSMVKEMFDIKDLTIKEAKKAKLGSITCLGYHDYIKSLSKIDIVKIKGTGKIIQSGMIGEDIEKQNDVILFFIKSKAKEYGYENFNFDKFDFCIDINSECFSSHSGTSASTAFTTAIISSILNKPIPTKISMTGSMDLFGNVVKIGKLREKITQAYQNGLTEFFVPFDNKKDAEEISPEVMKKIKIHFVKNYDEIFKIIFKGGKKDA